MKKCNNEINENEKECQHCVGENKKSKNIISIIIEKILRLFSWCVCVFFTLGAFAFVSDGILCTILVLIIGLINCPIIVDIIYKKTSFKLKWWHQICIFLILMIMVMNILTIPETSQDDKNDNAIENVISYNNEIENKVDESEDVDAAHVCKFEVSQTIDATCESDGKIIYICASCQKKDEELIKAKGHSYENGICLKCGKKDPTYVEDPLMKYDLEENITTFVQTYYNNELDGNKKYFGKRVKLTGKLMNIDTDESVFFNTGITCFLNANGKYVVACNFLDGNAENLSNYSRGENITIIGKVDTLKDAYPTDAVYLEECIVVTE